MKPYLCVSLLVVSLSACIKAPTLQERLAGKTGSERERELYYACIQRADYSIPGGHDGTYVGHESRIRALCDAMHKTNTQEEEHATR